MKIQPEKIFNHWTLLVINILIVIAAEASGTFFARSGLIHLLAIIFVGLGLVRLWFHTHVHDQYLEPIIHRGILALLVLAISHIVEYVSFMHLKLPRQAIYANVINFYLAGLLIINLGVEGFLRKLRNDSSKIIPTSWIVIAGFFVLIGILFMNPQSVSLSPGSWHVFGYLLATTLVATFSIYRLTLLKNHVAIMVKFISYFIAAIILISACAVISATEEYIAQLGVPTIQIAFINHFLFYGALSLVFLAYERLLHLGGVYDDLEKLYGAQ